ncbi:MAG: polysaccharide pyruvyl transferase family protein [Succinimonas sp.]|nr:polysaccharide pyruvyl transferase family protein [Succinimonas sp.]
MTDFKVAYLAWLGSNYGSVLQSFALYRSMEKLGYRCEVIDYDHFIRDAEPPSALKDADPKRYDDDLIRYNFDLFAHRHFVFNPILQKISDDLTLSPAQNQEINSFAAFVAGSDQIWKPAGFWFSRKQYLQFAPALKRIGYAPSVGWKTIPAAHEKNIPQWKEWLSGVAYLSAREPSGAALIAEAAGRPVANVTDPTMLLTPEEWLSAMTEPRYAPEIADILHSGARFMLAYFLDHRALFEKKIRALARRLGLKIVWLSGRAGIGTAQDNCAETDPAGFINLISKASLVCADGFHGTCLALNFAKPVIFFSPAWYPEKSNDARVSDLFTRFGIDPATRTVTPRVPVLTFVWELDYDDIKPRIAQAREASLTYLRNALLGAAESRGPLFQELKESGALHDCFTEEHYSGKVLLSARKLKFAPRLPGAAECHTIRDHAVIVPALTAGAAPAETPEPIPVYAPLGVTIPRGTSYEIHIRAMLLTASPAVDIFICNAASSKDQAVLTIRKSMMGQERWLDLYAKFTADDDGCNALMIDASQLTGSGSYISFDTVDIVCRDR